jgi:hypothetical protein
MGNSNVVVPTVCIKGAKKMKTNEWILIEEFTNTSTPVIRTIKEKGEIFTRYGIKIDDLERIFYEKRKL